MRVLIIGAPKTGKSTLAREWKERDGRLTVRSTDETIEMGLDWSAGSAEVAKWLDEPGPWLIEGVAVPRALRKWRDAHPGSPPPCDKVIYLDHVYEPHTKGQAAMAKGIETVLNEIRPWLADV